MPALGRRARREGDLVLFDFGAVVTMEPGIYIPRYGGGRIEEMALVTEVGCQVLNESQRVHLVELPA